jgi:hypothetical protein
MVEEKLTSQVVKQPRGVYSPYFGCLIFSVIILSVVFVGGMAYYSLTNQDAAISVFASDTPVTLKAQTIPAEQRPALVNKLKAFAQDLIHPSNPEVALSLSIAELNTLIELAPDSGYGSFKEMIAFTQALAETQQLVADVCLPLNRIRFWEGKRYAVGKSKFKPMIAEKVGLDFQLQSLEIPGKTVSEDFIDRLMLWHWLTPYNKAEGVGTVLAAISKVKVTSSGITLLAKSSPPIKTP